MSLWNRLVNFVEGVDDDEGRLKDMHEEELRVASAALLINAGSIDGKFDSNEKQKVKALLQRRFDLKPDELKRLFQEASAEEREAVDLYRFTKVLCRNLDQDGRKRIVVMLWEVVMADGVVDEFEANLVWRVAELIGVSTRDRVTLRKMVEARLAI
ncbi:MAG: TerB family tellurite resistance protein [Methyloceanibacter sp.]|uniref:tellurite resistance TerB family protein n=1 Tax=Methyloceanibacter sp. TaxID=1965321 RepID=UPI003C40403C